MATVAISKGLETRVDAKDLVRVVLAGKWTAHSAGYAYRMERKDGKTKSLLLHRFITNAPYGLEVDHINGDKLDNRSDNLRIVSRAGNQLNKPGAKLVEQRKDGLFTVRVKADGVKRLILTAIETEEEALHVARDVRRQMVEGDVR